MIKKSIKIIFTNLLRGCIALFLAIFIYLATAWLGSLIPYCSPEEPSLLPKELLIFVQTNGTHTDLVIPVKAGRRDWRQLLDARLFADCQDYSYWAFGWGDAAYYIASKTSPSILTTFRALFLPTESLIHLKMYQKTPVSTEERKALRISLEQYEKICQYLEAQFIKDRNGKICLIEPGYGSQDYFFKAKGSYHLFNTCNNWTNRGLKEGKICAGFWTPLAGGVMRYF